MLLLAVYRRLPLSAAMGQGRRILDGAGREERLSRCSVPARLAPEFEFLCHCLRNVLGTSDPAAFHAACAAVGDWDKVVRGARRHRIGVLALEGIRAQPGLAVPAETMEALKRHVSANVRGCLGQAAELVRLTRLLERAGIRTIVLKGVALAVQLHGAVAARGRGDIDLLVDPDRFWAADEVLTGAGYERLCGPLTPHHRRYAHLIRDLGYRDPGRGHVVELHRRLNGNPALMDMGFEALWHGRGAVEVAGAALSTLPAEVLPTYLVVHGAHHCWERLSWIMDVAVLLKQAPARAAALERARGMGLEPATRLVLALAADWLALPIPGAAPLRPAEHWRLERVRKEFFHGDCWLEQPGRGTAAWFRRELWRRLYEYSLTGRLRDGWRQFVADLGTPADWGIIRLPGSLLWLYPVLRPFGWVVRNWISTTRRKN